MKRKLNINDLIVQSLFPKNKKDVVVFTTGLNQVIFSINNTGPVFF